jgi:ADP-ribose pyrophosphatase
MHEIVETQKVFENRWLNLFERCVKTNDKLHSWLFVSRQSNPELASQKKPDAVVIVAMTDDHKIVVTREYRVPIGDYEIGFPAGLIEEGQTPEEAAIREMKEETGMDLKVIHVSENLFSSAGMTNESIVYVFGHASGVVSSEHLQENEDIQVSLQDKFEFSDSVSARAWPLFMLFDMVGIKNAFMMLEVMYVEHQLF